MKIRRQSLFCVSLSNTYGDPVKVLLLSPLRLHILGGGALSSVSVVLRLPVSVCPSVANIDALISIRQRAPQQRDAKHLLLGAWLTVADIPSHGGDMLVNIVLKMLTVIGRAYALYTLNLRL